MSDRRKGGFDRIGGLDRDPMTGRKVVESQKNLLVLLCTLHCLRILVLIGFHKGLERLLRFFPILRIPDLPDLGLGPGLEGLGKVVQDIQSFVEPAALFRIAGKISRRAAPKTPEPRLRSPEGDPSTRVL